MRYAIVAMLCACVSPSTVTCDDGTVCPGGTVCVAVTDSSRHLCADPAALCDLPENTPCTLPGNDDPAVCHSGVCIAAACGNGFIDPGEVCDDGNSQIGDGCSDNCLSNETCGNGIIDPIAVDPVTNHATPREACDDGGLVGHDGCTNQCQTETAVWRAVLPDAPIGRINHGLAYDTHRRRFVMFGGAHNSGGAQSNVRLDDTWESDGHDWIQIEPPLSPPGRAGHVMIYDPVRARVVLFGGEAVGLFADTWEWDGIRWVDRTTVASPPARTDAAMVYDAKHRRVVLFGGKVFSNNVTVVVGDTWAWDGTSWTQLATTTPPPARFGARMAYDPARGVIVLVHGADFLHTNLGDTWELDDTTWRQANANDQLPDGSAIAFDGVGRHVISYGGDVASSAQKGTWSWDGSNWTFFGANEPGPREQGLAASDPATGRVLMFGGGPSLTVCPLFASLGCISPDGQTWTFDGTAWSKQSSLTFATPLSASQTAYDPLRGRLIAVDPDTLASTLDGTFEFDGVGFTQSQGPALRKAAAVAFDALHDQLLVFGGQDNNNSNTADTQIRTAGTWQTAPVSMAPSARFDAVATGVDLDGGGVVLFGGRDGLGNTFADTWRWDGAAWTPIAGAGPPERAAAAIAYDPLHRQVVMFGGDASGISLADTWTFDGTAWTARVVNPAPSARTHAMLAWSPARGRIELFGGITQNGTGQPIADTWEWDGAGWTPLQFEVTPDARSRAMFGPMPDGSGLVVIGGQAPETAFPDARILRFDGAASYESCLATADDDGDGLAGCADRDCWASCTPLCPPIASPDGACLAPGPKCGDGVCDSPRESCQTCPADCPCAPACGDFVCDPGEDTTCPGDCPT